MVARTAFAAACALLLASAGWSQASQDPLPRRGFFGVALAPDESGQGVLVTSVLPGSTAEAASIAANDIITAVDGAATTRPEDVIAAMSRHRAGAVAIIDLRRGDEALHVEASLKALPQEQMENAVLTYSSVTTDDDLRLRTILSIPTDAQGPSPAVMLLGGGGCGSIDAPIGPPVADPALMHTFGSQGFVTYRVEKPGMGDSEGPPCAETGYVQELNGYRAGLADLRANPAVDPERIFLMGSSLGGFFAPIIANEIPVAGIVTYGTIDFAPSPYPGRSERFFAEIADVDILGEWSRIDVPTLVLHGEFDENTQAEWSASIADTVNAAHPGRAEHREFPGLDHCRTRHPSMEAAAGRCGQGEPVTDVSDVMLAFLREHAG